MSRILAFGAIVYCGHFLTDFRSSKKIWATIFHGKNYVLCNVVKKCTYRSVLGEVIINSSGHPEHAIHR
jgi:hypothetical protein